MLPAAEAPEPGGTLAKIVKRARHENDQGVVREGVKLSEKEQLPSSFKDVSFRDKVVGFWNTADQVSEVLFSDESDGEDGDDDPRCPTIRIPDDDKKRVRRKFENAVIINTLGKSFPFAFTSRKIQQIWAKKGDVSVSDVGWGFYVVKFQTIEDFDRAMFGGPWMVILKRIGDRIGKIVRIDHTTLEASRGNFARICVEVDLSKPLLSKYHLRRRVRRIEYEGLHTICFACGCYEHEEANYTESKE
ncbi:hypothetical protein LINPERHAP2_LOCUS35546 [Linum perenne]